MKYLSLSIPGFDNVDTGNPKLTPLPEGVPTGGLLGTGESILNTFITLIAVVAVFFALWEIGKGGIDMIQSRGLKEKFASGRDRVIFGVFGLIMFFLSFVFLNVLSAFFGIDLLPFLFKR